MRKTRRVRDRISVYYSVTTNFGDGINPLVFNHFIGNKAPLYKSIEKMPSRIDTPYILGIGSLLSWKPDTDSTNQIVCGTGFISKDKKPQKPMKIISVRGTKTRKKFMDAGIQCPAKYGDLALLLKYIIPAPKVEKKYRFGFIPHRVDKNHPYMKKVASHPDWTILDINQAYTPENFVKELHECEYILSSTLHGIIVADSYGIPAYHIELSDRVIGGDWKFKDYYSSVKRKYSNIDISSMDEKSIMKQLNPYDIVFDFDGYYKYIKDELLSISHS